MNGKAYTQTVLVKNDPRSPASATELAAQVAMQKALYDRVNTAWTGYQQVSTMRATVTPLTKHASADVAKAATDFDTKLGAIGGPAGNAGRGGGGGAPGGAPAPPNFRTAHAAQLRQLNSLDTGDLAPNETMTNVFNTTCRDLRTLVTDWTALNAKALKDLNAVLAKSNVPAVAMATPALTAPTCVAAPAVAAKK